MEVDPSQEAESLQELESEQKEKPRPLPPLLNPSVLDSLFESTPAVSLRGFSFRSDAKFPLHPSLLPSLHPAAKAV